MGPYCRVKGRLRFVFPLQIDCPSPTLVLCAGERSYHYAAVASLDAGGSDVARVGSCPAVGGEDAEEANQASTVIAYTRSNHDLDGE